MMPHRRFFGKILACFLLPITFVLLLPGELPAIQFPYNAYAAAKRSFQLQIERNGELREEITVTASRTHQELSATAASLITIDAPETNIQGLDDALRQVPGFTLFRRSGSRFAHPTTQGVSLRAVGGSGAGRALVIVDGIPLNDPFGGWVYWNRIPTATVDHIEILRGGGSELYGSFALGGVVQLIRRPPQQSSWAAAASIGSLETSTAAFDFDYKEDNWWISGAAQAFKTDGYIQIPEDVRGPVDTNLNSEYGTGDIRIGRSFGASSFFAGGSYYSEDRENGTRLQANDTIIRHFNTGLDVAAGSSLVQVRGFYTRQGFHASFSAIEPERSAERLTRTQFVPADASGFSAAWTLPANSHLFLSGIDFQSVDGISNETVFTDAGSFASANGGKQRTFGIFLQDVFTPSARLNLTAAIRLDSWKNSQTGGNSESISPDERSEVAVSPRLSALYTLTDNLALAASIYKGFRAPTLNELYRPFRAGNVLTMANPDLDAENVRGIEGGLNVRLNNSSARLRFFAMKLNDNIANITISSDENLIVRQRLNVGTTQSTGFEADLRIALSKTWSIYNGWLIANSKIADFELNPQLEGKRLPQVPRYQISANLEYSGRSNNILFRSIWTGEQFEDDENLLPLQNYFITSIFYSYKFGKGFEFFAEAENIFNTEYETGRTPALAIGPPRMIHAGLRFNWQP